MHNWSVNSDVFGLLSPEGKKAFEDSVQNFAKDLGAKCLSIKAEKPDKELLNAVDVQLAVSNMHKIQFPSTPTSSPSKQEDSGWLSNHLNSGDDGDPDMEEVQVRPSFECFFKRNQGPSKYVQGWLQSHPQVALNVCFGSAVFFRRLVSLVKECSHLFEVNFDFSPANGMTIQSLGSASISLLCVQLNAQAFESFTCSRAISLGIHLGALEQFLKLATKNDQISLLCAEEAKECTFVLEDGNKTYKFDMKLKMMQPDLQQIKQHPHTNKYSLPSSLFQKLCRDLKATLKSTTARLEAKQHLVSFIGETGFGSLQLDFHEPQLNQSLFTSESRVVFSHAHLTRFGKVLPLTSTININFGNAGAPLMLEYNLEKMGFVHYFLVQKALNE